jgi:hypothetical protein
MNLFDIAKVNAKVAGVVRRALVDEDRSQVFIAQDETTNNIKVGDIVESEAKNVLGRVVAVRQEQSGALMIQYK